MPNVYDLIIIGTGPAGYAAAIYASRFKLKNLVIGEIAGGLASEAHKIENYLGFVEITGRDLMEKFRQQAEHFGSEIFNDNVVEIKKNKDQFKVKTRSSKDFLSRTLILALGSAYKKLNVRGEREFLGKGVSYCPTCDGPFFKGKIVAVIGGADSAVMAAIHLSEFAQQVYLIYRREKLRAEPIWTERVQQNKKVQIIYQTNVLEIQGRNKVEKMILDQPWQGKSELAVDGVFIEIGSVPNVALIKDLGIVSDKDGFINIKEDGSTSVAGIFAAGDVTTGSNKLRQVITAVAEGAIAAKSAYEYLRKG
jgi:thioredoxin reductase (NADPH)